MIERMTRNNYFMKIWKKVDHLNKWVLTIKSLDYHMNWVSDKFNKALK